MIRMSSKQGWCLVCAVMLLGAFAALPALSQAPAGPPTPSPELAKLAFFAGDWTCKGKAEASPFGPAHATLGKVSIHKEIGGFWYMGRYEEKKTAENPQPIVFQFVQGYDGTAKAFIMECGHARARHLHQDGSRQPGAHRRDADGRQVDGHRSRNLHAGQEVKEMKRPRQPPGPFINRTGSGFNGCGCSRCWRSTTRTDRSSRWCR
ncbi:MAG: hypothetical protein DMF53_09850 [Acidobacteria bacterium]|nr:MAG: hypothetical protein DMF53_09850 [Acidobacteriota bacterium]